MRPRIFLLLAGCTLLSFPLSARDVEPPPAAVAAPVKVPFVKSEAEAAVGDLATKLEDNFVLPDVAKQYAAMLRANLAAGKYASFADADAFAKAVTGDLQTVHKDGHLHLEVIKPDPATGKREQRPPTTRSGMISSGWINEDVAYVRFDGFPGNEATLTDIRNFLATHANAKTLIIDARKHHGGGIEEMNLIFPQLFAKETVVVDMDTRIAVARRFGEEERNPFFRKVSSPDTVLREEHFVVPAKTQGGLAKAQVFLLVSHDTASAGEHLALSLKRTHRATLIGETTRGAGNYGMFMPVAAGYLAFIPFGRTFDPDTGDGWEGVGVKPDVDVPADQALDEALRLARVKTSGAAALAALH
jgi:hypothetical protein